MISAGGIIACLITSFFGIYIARVTSLKSIQNSLNIQLLLSTLLTIAVIIGCIYILPSSWTSNKGNNVKRWYAFICALLGLLSGLLIGASTYYFTTDERAPVKEMAKACTSGAAINIIYGLALGYMSTLVPIFLLAVTVLISVEIAGLLGVGIAAVGMLSTLCITLAIDAYGPISDNAGGISEMSELGSTVRARTDALDSAGNTTAAIGKGFAIGSATLVFFALYGAFITRAKKGDKNPIIDIEFTNPWMFASMLFGAMLPYVFSALTMKSVGMAAQEMVNEVRR